MNFKLRGLLFCPLAAVAGILWLAMSPASAITVVPQQTFFNFGIVPIGETATLDVVIDVDLLTGEEITLTPQAPTDLLFSIETDPCHLTAPGSCIFSAFFTPLFLELTVSTTDLVIDSIGLASAGEGLFGQLSATTTVRLQGISGTASAVPAPMTLTLLAAGLGVTGLLGRTKKRATNSASQAS